MLDLQLAYLNIVKNILSQYVPDMVVWAYGSRVKHTAHSASDLDLVIINPNDSTIAQNNIAALHTAFAESNLPILVDVSDWALLPDSFHEEIRKNYEVIQIPKISSD